MTTGVGVQEPAVRRTLAFAGICLTHALFLWVFLQGLANRFVDVVVKPFETTILVTKPPVAPVVPVLRAALRAAPAVQVAPPVIRIAIASPAPASSVSVGTAPRGATGQVERRTVPAPTSAVFLSAPDSEELYPPLARDLGEQGVVLLEICIDANARVERVEVLRSSSYRRLDDAAMVIGQRSRWKSATRAGRSVPDCNPFRVEFVHRPH